MSVDLYGRCGWPVNDCHCVGLDLLIACGYMARQAELWRRIAIREAESGRGPRDRYEAQLRSRLFAGDFDTAVAMHVRSVARNHAKFHRGHGHGR